MAIQKPRNSPCDYSDYYAAASQHILIGKTSTYRDIFTGVLQPAMSHRKRGRPLNTTPKQGVRNPKTKNKALASRRVPKKIIQHRDTMNRLSPNAPVDVRQEDRRLIMVKGGS